MTAHWGYLMGLTAANIGLTRVLIASGVIKQEAILDELALMRRDLANLPDAVRWLEITANQIVGGGNDPDSVQ